MQGELLTDALEQNLSLEAKGARGDKGGMGDTGMKGMKGEFGEKGDWVSKFNFSKDICKIIEIKIIFLNNRGDLVQKVYKAIKAILE